MIVTYEKHGRSAQDAAYLLAHLQKPENDFVRVLEIGNSLAEDMTGVLRDMRILRDGSSAKASFHHLSINPAKTLSDEVLRKAVHAVRLEMDPSGERPFFIVAHGKERVGAEAAVHAHLVVGHVDGKGRALKDGRCKIRTEAVARILEFSLRDVETPTLGRHHKQALKILHARGLHDVAAWLVETHGEDPERPRSAMSSRSRQKAKRAGIDIPKAKVAIAAAWAETRSRVAFEAALAILGYAVVAGKKQNVWIVVDRRGNSVGSLDRLLRVRRGEVKRIMEGQDERDSKGRRAGPAPHDSGAWPQDLRQIAGDIAAYGSVETAAGLVGAAHRRRATRPGSDDRAIVADAVGAESPADGVSPGHRRQARCVAEQFRHRVVLNRLRTVGRCIATNAACVKTLGDFAQFGGLQLPRNWFLTDIWGIPIEPPQKFHP